VNEIKLAGLVICSVPPYLVGYIAGVVVRGSVWVWSGVVIGYRRGRYGVD